MIIYVLWLIVLIVLFDHFRVWFLMMALIIALAGGVLDALLAYLMAGKTQVTVGTETHSTEKNGEVPVYIHIVNNSVIPSSEIRITLLSENEFYGSRQETEIVYPLYSAADYSEKLPVTFSMPGTYRFSLTQASVRDFLGFADIRMQIDSETEITVFPTQNEVTGVLDRADFSYKTITVEEYEKARTIQERAIKDVKGFSRRGRGSHKKQHSKKHRLGKRGI
ncbi:MAG: hypothetical protein PUF16_03655 [Lachnospiraceae bacterium]|nr:hypothetical protein [Lachnospiraceae bacterium]